ncbi:MAG TPA: Rne/Rng family ribonuclease [Bryobacteraceae bacterium]|nr:Rne/Rng family ribonuclease [Bryobacteraceae bacterium]HOQ43770.1 Rne/Rng family ribonuclease [Bryobacteraceae bacterium]HPU71787.1 Rne/Rng family ribonuclease [Bryobacteraceae bacterium]
MGKELIISSNRHETKLAILEDDQLVEVYFQRANEYSLAGSIHKGRVTRVLPGMQSAFVDIGLERDAFLYVSDFFEDNEEYDRIAGNAEEKALRAEKGAPAETSAAPQVEAPTPQAGSEENEGRDRKSRRSRRRRSRSRGFPESKYAADIGGSRRESEAEEREKEFPVLPGEVLAKYSNHETGEEPQEAEETAAQAEPGENAESLTEDEIAAQDPTLALGPAAEQTAEEAAEEEPSAEEAAAVEPAAEELAVEEAAAEEAAAGEAAAEQPAAEVAAEEPAAEEAGAEQAAAEEPATKEAVEAAPAEEASVVAEEAAEETTPGAALAEEATEETTPEAAEEAAAEEPVTETGVSEAAAGQESETAPEEESEGAPLAGFPEGAVPEEAPSESPAAEAETSEEEVEPARMPISLTATLREQGYRYPHRVSRRARRKMRAALAESEVKEAPARETVETEPAPGGKANGQGRHERPPQPSITELLKEGQEILVQIAKEPLGQKGARITSHIALPGRYVVYMPTVEHLGVSRKIASDEERQRLKRILQNHRTGIPGGYIVRTAGEGKDESEIASDMKFLFNLWLDIRQKAEARKAPALIHHDLDVVSRVLRDQISEQFKTIWVDSEEVYETVLRFVERFQPNTVGRVKLYTRDTPIFDAFNVTSELEKALRPKVWLKSGGYIVINQTEALVAIDVNTGKFVGKSNRLEDTIVKTNLEAVKEIVRQIRLRDLGGIIVVDFIDMDERKNRQKVMQALEEAMRADRAPNKILQFNDFGLVAITRKRVKQSLERTLCSPCPYCDGAGYVKSVQTVVGEIIQEAHKIARAVEGPDVTLRVNPEVAKFLKASDNNYLEELEEVLGRPVLVISDATLQQEKFDLV